MEITVLTLVVIAANVLGGAMAVPQARKLVRNRSVEGVSVTWAAISATVNACWAGYGLGVGDMSIVPVSVVAVMSYVLIAVAVVRFSVAPARRLLPRAITSSVGIAALPVLALAIDGWVSAGIVLGALYGIQLAPAVVAVYRAADVGGVSSATWAIGFAEAALWGVYGLATIDVGLMSLAVTGLAMTSLVLARLFLRRPHRSSRSAAVGVPGYAMA